MDDIIRRMRDEETALVRKLEAVRQFLIAYDETSHPPGPVKSATPALTVRSARVARSFVDRIDKFGDYGKRVVEAAARCLPPITSNPVLTRELVVKLEALGVEIRGENKVNALSALLARSSQMKGHGKAGWTLAAPSFSADEELHSARIAPNGNEASEEHIAEATENTLVAQGKSEPE